MPDTAVLQLETDRLISTRGYSDITKRNASEMLSFSTGSVLIPSVVGGGGGDNKKEEGEKRRLLLSPCCGFFPRRIFIRLSSLWWLQAASFGGTLGFTNAVSG